jgi:LuxR family maltose regulon positive regulatory protein
VLTKLVLPPPRTVVVPRPRLIDRLEAGLQGKLTVITAPAGYGKITLVSAWHATEAGQAWPLAWLALDPNDNDPVRFWTYVISALQTVQPGLGTDRCAGPASVTHASSLGAILTLLINALARIPHPVVLVRDDYHAITAPAIHESLTFLLEHQPARLRLVITSRSAPPLPLMRLRARGEVSDLRAADLSFTTTEVETLFNRLLDLNLAPQEVAALATRTEGWFAGLVLAAHALHGHADAAAFISALSGSQRFILDYLVEFGARIQAALRR